MPTKPKSKPNKKGKGKSKLNSMTNKAVEKATVNQPSYTEEETFKVNIEQAPVEGATWAVVETPDDYIEESTQEPFVGKPIEEDAPVEEPTIDQTDVGVEEVEAVDASEEVAPIVEVEDVKLHVPLAIEEITVTPDKVTIHMAKSVSPWIGGHQYFFTKGKSYKVPFGVASILQTSGDAL